MQTFASTCKHMQTKAGTCKRMQANESKCNWMRAARATVSKCMQRQAHACRCKQTLANLSIFKDMQAFASIHASKCLRPQTYARKHRQLQALKPSPPRMPPGRPQEIFRRIMAAVKDIQAGGKRQGVGLMGSSGLTTPALSPCLKHPPQGAALPRT